MLNETTLTLMGAQTPRTVIYKSESHKLHQAFNPKVTDGTSSTIFKGQPVKIENDGTISPFSGTGIYIGMAVTDTQYPAYGAQRDYPIEVTVAVTGHMIVNMVASAAVVPGYVNPTGTVVNNRFTQIANTASSGTTASNFIALNAASAAGDIVQVLCL